MKPALAQRYALADQCVDASASLASRLLPAALHPGRRARRELAVIASTQGWASDGLVRAVLASRWRSALLLRLVRQLDGAYLRAFVDSRVQFRNENSLTQARASGRPLVLATPHTQVSVLACLAAARRLAQDRPFAILYQSELRDGGIRALVESSGVPAILLHGFAGAVRALEILRRGGCVATMPDAFHDVADTIAVPFLGRWLRVAAGVAFLAQRSDALLLPGFARPIRGLLVRVDVGHPIDAKDPGANDERQAAFAVTCRLFAELERLIARAPEHWVYLERLRRLSTPLELARSPGSRDLAVALAARCRSNPALLRRVPELATLIQGDAS
jgi:lauroyl/myristoyl acyltransferase